MTRLTRGATIIEAVVSMALLVMVVIFVYSVFPQTMRSVELARGHGQASHLGRSLLEQARSTPYEALKGWREETVLRGTVENRQSDEPFASEVDVIEVEPGLKRVWAVVTWNSSSGPKRVVLETEVFKSRPESGATPLVGATASPSPTPPAVALPLPLPSPTSGGGGVLVGWNYPPIGNSGGNPLTGPTPQPHETAPPAHHPDGGETSHPRNNGDPNWGVSGNHNGDPNKPADPHHPASPNHPANPNPPANPKPPGNTGNRPAGSGQTGGSHSSGGHSGGGHSGGGHSGGRHH